MNPPHLDCVPKCRHDDKILIGCTQRLIWRNTQEISQLRRLSSFCNRNRQNDNLTAICTVCTLFYTTCFVSFWFLNSGSAIKIWSEMNKLEKSNLGQTEHIFSSSLIVCLWAVILFALTRHHINERDCRALCSSIKVGVHFSINLQLGPQYVTIIFKEFFCLDREIGLLE